MYLNALRIAGSVVIPRPVNEQLLIQTFLRRTLLELQAKNRAFSVRALARKLGMQPSATNEILKGERRVSSKVAERIATRLSLDPSERAELLRDFPMKLRRNSALVPNRHSKVQMKLSSEQFQALSNGLHFAILILMTTSKFQSDLSWIAKRLSVKDNEVRGALERMARIGLVRLNGSVWERTPLQIKTTDDVRDLSIQQSHLNDMALAQEKIRDVPVDQRDFTSFTFAVNPKLLPKAKEILRRAQDSLSELMDAEDPQEVYKVCMYLFPLTETENRSEV